MKTSLSLLTREGAVDVTFAAVLTSEQYARFFECVQSACTKAVMKSSIEQMASEFDLEVTIDGATTQADGHLSERASIINRSHLAIKEGKRRLREYRRAKYESSILRYRTARLIREITAFTGPR